MKNNGNKGSHETLVLTLKRQWFDMILAGEKLEEYREIKPYWTKRLEQESEPFHPPFFKEFDTVIFRNGYGKHAPEVQLELGEIFRGQGRPEWGAEPEKEYYVLPLGRIITKRNIK